MDWNEITGEKKKFYCKAILDKENVSLLGKEWALSKRCSLEILEDSIQLSDITIPFEEIKEATMRIYRSAYFIQGFVLTIKGESFCHNIGLNYSSYWKGELPFKVSRTFERAPYLRLRQAIVVALIIFTLYKLLQL